MAQLLHLQRQRAGKFNIKVDLNFLVKIIGVLERDISLLHYPLFIYFTFTSYRRRVTRKMTTMVTAVAQKKKAREEEMEAKKKVGQAT